MEKKNKIIKKNINYFFNHKKIKIKNIEILFYSFKSNISVIILEMLDYFYVFI